MPNFQAWQDTNDHLIKSGNIYLKLLGGLKKIIDTDASCMLKPVYKYSFSKILSQIRINETNW